MSSLKHTLVLQHLQGHVGHVGVRHGGAVLPQTPVWTHTHTHTGRNTVAHSSMVRPVVATVVFPSCAFVDSHSLNPGGNGFISALGLMYGNRMDDMLRANIGGKWLFSPVFNGAFCKETPLLCRLDDNSFFLLHDWQSLTVTTAQGFLPPCFIFDKDLLEFRTLPIVHSTLTHNQHR